MMFLKNKFILPISIFFFLTKWFFTIYLNQNIDFLTNIIFDLEDHQYFPLIFNLSNFNFNPTTPYANSRASIDLHLRNLFNTYKFPIIITRTANVYGPTQQIYRIIPKTILSVILKKKLSLSRHE